MQPANPDGRLAGRWPAVVCLGEALIDFVALDANLTLQEAMTFHRAAGGAPANVAVALARLGVASALVGKVGGDAFGVSLRQTLALENVDVRGLLVDEHAPTPLAFVGSDGRRGRTFVFYHAGMADTLLRPADVDADLLAHARVFHFGSVTLAEEPSASATLHAARLARQYGCLISFDPNVRLELWDSPARARLAITDALGLADVVKISGDELAFLTGSTDAAKACRALREHGPGLAVATLGSEGCYYDAAGSAGCVEAPPVVSVDTLGAGDAFVGGLLSSLADESHRAVLEDEQALRAALRFANAVGALTTTRYGAIPSLPTRAQVLELLASPTS